MTDEQLAIRKLYADAITIQALVNRLVSDLKPLADHGLDSNPASLASLPRTPDCGPDGRMSGLYGSLTLEERMAVLDYDGPETIGPANICSCGDPFCRIFEFDR